MSECVGFGLVVADQESGLGLGGGGSGGSGASDDALCGGIDLGTRRDVAADRKRFAAETLDERDRLGAAIGVAINARHVCTLLGQRNRGRLADALCGAGDDGDTVGLERDGEVCRVHRASSCSRARRISPE